MNNYFLMGARAIAYGFIPFWLAGCIGISDFHEETESVRSTSSPIITMGQLEEMHEHTTMKVVLTERSPTLVNGQSIHFEIVDAPRDCPASLVITEPIRPGEEKYIASFPVERHSKTRKAKWGTITATGKFFVQAVCDETGSSAAVKSPPIEITINRRTTDVIAHAKESIVARITSTVRGFAPRKVTFTGTCSRAAGLGKKALKLFTDELPHHGLVQEWYIVSPEQVDGPFLTEGELDVDGFDTGAYGILLICRSQVGSYSSGVAWDHFTVGAAKMPTDKQIGMPRIFAPIPPHADASRASSSSTIGRPRANSSDGHMANTASSASLLDVPAPRSCPDTPPRERKTLAAKCQALFHGGDSERIRLLEEENGSLVERCETLANEKRTLEARCAELERERNADRASLEQVTADRDRLARERATLEAQCRQLRQANERQVTQPHEQQPLLGDTPARRNAPAADDDDPGCCCFGRK